MVAKGFGEDGIAVKIIEYHEVLAALAGLGGKTTSLVSVDLTSGGWDINNGGVCDVTAEAVVVGWRGNDVGVERNRFCGLLVFAGLVEVSLGGGNGFGQVFGDVGDG